MDEVQHGLSEQTFYKDKFFDFQINKWEDLKSGAYVKVGTLGANHPIVKVGMLSGSIRYDVSKLKKLLNNPNNVIIYNKEKDSSQGTSGSMVPSVLSDKSFYNEIISHPRQKCQGAILHPRKVLRRAETDGQSAQVLP